MPQTTIKRTRFWRIWFALLVLICALAVPSGSTQQNTSDWKTIDVDGLFSFRVPRGWSKRSSFNVVDVRGEWYHGETKLTYVWGQTESGGYSDRRQSWMNDYDETTTRLGGRRANIRSFSKVKDAKRRYYAELNVGNWEKGEVQLYLRVEGSDAATIELAKQIFESIKFPMPSPERPDAR